MPFCLAGVSIDIRWIADLFKILTSGHINCGEQAASLCCPLVSQLPAMSKHVLVCPPPKCPFPCWDPGPHLIDSSLGTHESTPQMAPQLVWRFLHGLWSWPTESQTDIHRPCYCVCRNRLVCAVHATLPKR